MKNEKIRERKIDLSESIISALKQMDAIDKKLLMVFDNNRFVSVLSIGDIQRAILKNIPYKTEIKKILRRDIMVASNNDSYNKIKKTMATYRTECMPVVDENGYLVDVHFWEDVFGKEVKRTIDNLNLPVVIMAGGKGTRLKPLTNIIPKPLIPLGEKTVLEEIMDRFVDFGCNNFFISINYKAELIKQYFSQQNNLNYTLHFIEEKKPLGTIGSLYLLKEKINSTFFVSNCDIIINENYSEILKYHNDNNNELTIVSALKHYSIPYGTIKTGNNGVLKELIEKPEFTFQINSGMYILESHVLDEIPENNFLNITNLINEILRRNGRVGVFPISEGSWLDIGELKKYISNIKY